MDHTYLGSMTVAWFHVKRFSGRFSATQSIAAGESGRKRKSEV
jgi:hypothetical protein